MRGLILVILAIVLSVVILPIGFAFHVLTALFKAIDKYLFRIAKSIDQLGNVVCEHLLNVTMIKNNGYKFGNEDVTISHVLGVNKLNKTLTWTGAALSWLLNTIEKDHVEKAIENDSEI